MLKVLQTSFHCRLLNKRPAQPEHRHAAVQQGHLQEMEQKVDKSQPQLEYEDLVFTTDWTSFIVLLQDARIFVHPKITYIDIQ